MKITFLNHKSEYHLPPPPKDCHCVRGIASVAALPRNDKDSAEMKEKQYFMYIMTNKHNTALYTGVTNNLQRRVREHKSGKGGVFTKKYNIHKLVYYEAGSDINAAITREKQIKAGSRQKKIDLINNLNPEWKDLYEELFG